MAETLALNLMSNPENKVSRYLDPCPYPDPYHGILFLVGSVDSIRFLAHS